jgi:bacteriorhodopsin
MSLELLKLTTQGSLIIQALIGIIDIYGIGIKTKPEHQILSDALKIETFVQIIEFIVYLWIFSRFNVKTMAVDRYKDWFVTTPLMLFTTMIFMHYSAKLQNNTLDKKDTLLNFIKENKTQIVTVFLTNMSMLFFGLMGELGYMSLLPATLLGFVSLVFTFGYIYYHYARFSVNGILLFWVFSFLWSIYGIIYLLPVVSKNIGYNILDIFAKNFFGLYLFILIYRLKK